MIDTIPIDVRKDPFYKEGRQEGRQEGVLKGEELGVFKTALNCMNKGYSNDIINDVTGLSQDKIVFLRKKYKEHGKDILRWLKYYFEKQN